MSEYTPGALSALFANTSSNDTSLNDKYNKKLAKLFTKKIKNKQVGSDHITNREQTRIAEKPNSGSRSTDKVEAHNNLSNGNGEKSQTMSETKFLDITGPTVIPARTTAQPSNLRRIKNKRKRENNAENEDSEEIPTKFTRPSQRDQVRDEDAKNPKLEAEKESRTVFIGNLPTDINGKSLKRKLKEYGEVESVRLRSVARPDMKTTKKVAAIKRIFHENRHNVNAYVRFKAIQSAVNSCALNGTEIGSHIIRVDMAGMGKSMAGDGDKTQQHDQSKAVFIGNVKFSEEEDMVRKHFGKCGTITNVRLVRDSTTGIGKGFGYVNFDTVDSVEKAIQLNGSNLNGRSLRVSRAVNRPKQTLTLIERKKKSGPFGAKGGKPVTRKKSFTKVSKTKQKGITEGSYQGSQIENKVKCKRNTKKPKHERRKSMIIKKLAVPKKTKVKQIGVGKSSKIA